MFTMLMCSLATLTAVALAALLSPYARICSVSALAVSCLNKAARLVCVKTHDDLARVENRYDYFTLTVSVD